MALDSVRDLAMMKLGLKPNVGEFSMAIRLAYFVGGNTHGVNYSESFLVALCQFSCIIV